MLRISSPSLINSLISQLGRDELLYILFVDNKRELQKGNRYSQLNVNGNSDGSVYDEDINTG